MTKSELQRLLDAEVDQLSRRSYARLVEDLPDVLAYERGGGASYHQFEVQMIEHEPDYVHASFRSMTAAFGGLSLRSPAASSFIATDA